MTNQLGDEAQKARIKALLEEALTVADAQNLHMIAIRISEALDALITSGNWKPPLRDQ